jgi:hypothetical protein
MVSLCFLLLRLIFFENLHKGFMLVLPHQNIKDVAPDGAIFVGALFSTNISALTGLAHTFFF